MIVHLRYLLCFIFSIYTFASYADDNEILFNQVHLQASAEREVPNDQMQVLFVTEHEGREPAQLQIKVNKDMEWATNIVNKEKSIDASTKSYRTNPISRDRTIIAWRVSQELVLKSQAISKLTELIGRLQERLQVRQMFFSPTVTTRTQYEEELIEEAMESFKRRVKIVSKHMDGKEYRIVNLHINTNNQNSRPVMYAERATLNTMSASQAPSVEAGTSKVVVTVSGSVQFF